MGRADALEVRAEHVTARSGHSFTSAVLPMQSPQIVEPAGPQDAHLVDPATDRALCGQAAGPMTALSTGWSQIPAFYRCRACGEILTERPSWTASLSAGWA